MGTALPVKLSHKALFMGFFQAGIFGFGGVLPIARRMVVDERRWLSQAEFNELFSLCQSLPGANVVNFSVAFGARHQGLTGASAALAGLLMAPMAIVMVLVGFYGRYGGLAPVRHMLAGLAAAAAGLMLGSGLKISVPVFAAPRNIGVGALVAALVLMMHVPLPLTMLLALPLALFLAWRVTL